MPTLTFSIKKEIRDAMREIERQGSAGLFYKNKLTDIPNRFPTAWLDATYGPRMVAAFNQYGFNPSDIGNNQFRLDVWPTP